MKDEDEWAGMGYDDAPRVRGLFVKMPGTGQVLESDEAADWNDLINLKLYWMRKRNRRK